MGVKSSKTEVFYAFRHNTPNDLRPIEKLTKVLKGTHVVLKPQPPHNHHTPTLVFAECNPRSPIEELSKESRALSPNQLMVVLTSEVNPRFPATETMVQILWKNKGKNKHIEETEDTKRNVHLIAGFIARGGSANDREAAAAADTPSSSASGPVVHMAFGDKADLLLKDAVSFVETECQMRLKETSNLYASTPLLVFCKNDTQLQEDIRHATQNTRPGVDVMLLVVTDKEDLVLRDTEATKHFGAKGRLMFNQIRQKYSFTENEQTLKWIRKFLARHDVDIFLKMNRTSSMKRSWTKFRKSEGIGFYLVLGELSEEKLKNIVLFFDDLNVGLCEIDHGQYVSPLVVFCAASQQPEQRLKTLKKSRTDFRDIFIVIIHRDCDEVPINKSLPDAANFGKLAIADLPPKVLDTAQNNKVVDGVRKFLRKNTAPSQRRQIPRVDQVFATGHDLPERTECAHQCSSGDGGRSEPDTMDVEDDGESSVINSSASAPSEQGCGIAGISKFPFTTTDSSAPYSDFRSLATDTSQYTHGHTHYSTCEHVSQTEQTRTTQEHQSHAPSEQSDSHTTSRYVSEVRSWQTPPTVHQDSRQPSTYSHAYSQISKSSSDGPVLINPHYVSSQHTESRDYRFPSQTVQPGETVSRAAVTLDNPSHKSGKMDSWAKRRRRRQPVPFQGIMTGQTTDDMASISRERSRERGPKRRVRDRNEDEGTELIHMFEDMTINLSKKKKSAPYNERKAEKSHAQKEALWVRMHHGYGGTHWAME